MKAIILAAGKGVRMLPLTKKLPKPMLRVHEKPILEHIINILPKEISEIILVVGYKGEMIKKYFKDKNLRRNIKINFVTQRKISGVWKSLKATEKYLGSDEKFFLIFADDMHDRKSLQQMVKYKNSILAFRHVRPESFGVLEIDIDNFLTNIEEKPKNPKTTLVATGAYVLNSKIFKCKDPKIQNGEYFLTGVLRDYLKFEKIKVVSERNWLPIGTPSDYIFAHDSNLFD